ncbi:MAG: pyridoxamine 5'-phosphate oxidase [Ferruginibacter sp.]
MSHIADIRRDYQKESLSETDVKSNPFLQFDTWWSEALNSEIDEVNAMTLATASTDGKPSARIVLLKGYDPQGFVFFSNYHSHKGIEIEKNPFCSLVFFWKELERQIRIEGGVRRISAQESDAYFYSRPATSRIGAWASPQSKVIPSRNVLDENVIELEKSFADKEIERPPHWGGYIVEPNLIEFWQGRPSRLHDRIQYRLTNETSWTIERLAP